MLRSSKPTKRWRHCTVHPHLGWERYVVGELKSCTIRSSHGKLFKEPKVRRLAKMISDHVSRAQLDNATVQRMQTRTCGE